MLPTLSGCCARAANGQTTVELTISLMKSRRRIARPQAQDHITRQLQQVIGLGGMRFRVTLQSSNPKPPMSALGQKRRLGAPARCPLYPQ